MNLWRRFMIGTLRRCFSEDEVLSFALDGMQGASRQVAKAHLDHCEHCREALRAVMELQDALAATAPTQAAPPGLAERIRAKVQALPKS